MLGIIPEASQVLNILIVVCAASRMDLRSCYNINVMVSWPSDDTAA
jgi:hypothetical protein